MTHSILIVDDEAGIRESLCSILAEEGYRPEAVASAEEALAIVDRGGVDIVLMDIWLPGMDGMEALERLQASARPPVVVMITGHGNIETAVRATKLGAFDFIEKPLSLEKIIVVIKNSMARLRLEEENRRLRAELEQRYQVIGESVPMKALRQQIAVTAPTNGRVLIYGESGTGKELVAHALHVASRRSNQPFVEVNCAAIPEELIESELFGHIKGSFTGASEDKTGKFQKADGGTLFLDEVGDMSLKTQSKVLRVLEEQRFEPVGSNAAVKVDVRVIAATNKKLEEEIARGSFREDLFYRLNVILFSVRVQLGVRPQDQGAEQRGARRSDALSLARQRARTAQPYRAARHHLSPAAHRTAAPSAGSVPRRGAQPATALLNAARSAQRV